jgi:hypothetical protein
MNQLKFLIVLTLFISFKSISQEKEYIVTNNNDTIYGKVIRGTNWLNTSEVIFKIKDNKGKKTLIKPSEVKTIRSLKGVDGECFIITIYDKWFLKKIIDGRIKVYQLIDGTILYVSKDDSDIMSTDIGLFFSSKKAHSQIRPLIEDNPSILKEYNSLKGSSKNILRIIKKYNRSQK